MQILTLAVCLLLSQEKAYDLKLDAPRKAGQRTRLAGTEHMTMSMKADGQLAAAKEDKKLFEALEEVVASDGRGGEELRWTFSKAERLVEGEMKPYGFQGKTVKVKLAKGKEREFAYADGGKISEEDLEALKKAFGEDDREEASKAFAPSKPVKVGESWMPDVAAVARAMDEELAAAVDAARSKASFTLKAVERRDGADFGKIDGILELALGSMGPLKLETPVVMKMSLEMDVCVDGNSPLGTMKVKGEMKGGSAAEVEGQKFRVDLDILALGLMSKTAE